MSPRHTADFHRSLFEPLLPDTDRPLVHWQRLYGSALGLTVVEAAKRAGPVVMVTQNARAAQRLEHQVRFYCSGLENIPVHTFPDWECLPYDRFSPHPDIVSQRLLTLSRLPHLNRGIVITTATSVVQCLPPTQYLETLSFVMQVGEYLDVDALRTRLQSAGYHAVNQTQTAGEYSVRGGVIDIFPSGNESPFRIDLFDDQIESIRYFDPETQRSTETVSRIQVLPAREFPSDESGIKHFRSGFRRLFPGDPQKSSLYREVSNGAVPPGIEFYLPLFFEHSATFFDYLPAHAIVVYADDVQTAIDNTMADARDRFDNATIDRDRPPLPPEMLFMTADQMLTRLQQYRRVLVQSFVDPDVPASCRYHSEAVPEFPANPRAHAPYAKFLEYINAFPGRLLLVAETAGRRETLIGLLRENALPPKTVDGWSTFLAGADRLAITVAPLEQGLVLTSPSIAVLTETQLYGQRVLQRRRRSAASQDPESMIRSLAELSVGDPVVHEDHGVGRYRGLQVLTIDGNQTEFLTLEYYGGDKLYIPVLSLNAISRYIGAGTETAPLHKLGSEVWIRAKQRATERAYDVAAEILETEALRSARKGHAFPKPDDSYVAFSSAFPFEETPDQAHVIEDITGDMISDNPMDRLVCGDVGFGKTEVAFRAAFLAIQGNRQVAVLVPTTLLAQQHFGNFRDRFADLPVTITLLSRFRTQKQQAQAIKGLADGTIDIAIGTHRLLQRDVRFKRLGLVIIDEEHRFGVRQKQRLKTLRAQTDILTLTATPIPRTLNIALAGLRDISIIATPPRSRLSIKTFVREWNKSLIREACLRELRRAGQVYFLHNEVRSIDKYHQALSDLVPEAQIRVAHGQLRERDLEHIMTDFYHQRFNVLLCTTIIESGIDVPTANTIIINRADRFGLAQLHQLRGRVGRSHHQAYAYLLTPPTRTLTPDAVKRLQAIESLEDLGVGFALASHDLEIRGAGELLGEAQSGTIDEIGFTMYTEFLNRAISSIKTQSASASDTLPHKQSAIEINLHVPALFPETYLPDVHLRLMMYKRITNVMKNDQLHELQVEVVDRFGLLPPAAKTLFRLAELRIQLTELGIKRLEIGPKGGHILFEDSPNIDPTKLIELLQTRPEQYRMKSPTTLRVIGDFSDAELRFQEVKNVLELLA